MADFSNAKVGDKVMDKALFGDMVGKIVDISPAVHDGRIAVLFTEKSFFVTYYSAGNVFSDAIPTLRYLCPDGTLSDVRPEPKKVVNWVKVQARVEAGEDVKVWVWHKGDDNLLPRYLCSYAPVVCLPFKVYVDGKTKFTTILTEVWSLCKLAEPEKFLDCMEDK